VLSQKPFVLDLDVGQELVDLADRHRVKLAVNQNGRWAPHFGFARAAVDAGLLGAIAGVHMSVHWDHTWTKGTQFEQVKHLILYDFAIHWFDMVNCLLVDETPRRVFASVARTSRQTLMPPLLAQALIEYDNSQSTLAFDADTDVGGNDRVYVTGEKGSIHCLGPSYQDVTLTMDYAAGDETRTIQPKLEGQWFPDGFHGTMGELLCSIEQRRTPSIDAARNLQSLAMCFAAVHSAETHQPVVPGSVRRMPE
jgi:predicted dehydrogenase